MCLLGKEVEHFGFCLHVVGKLELFRCLHDVVEVDARTGVHGAPDDDRQIEEQCLTHQDQGHPLVVDDRVLLTVLHFSRDVLVEMQPVGVPRKS